MVWIKVVILWYELIRIFVGYGLNKINYMCLCLGGWIKKELYYVW